MNGSSFSSLLLGQDLPARPLSSNARGLERKLGLADRKSLISFFFPPFCAVVYLREDEGSEGLERRGGGGGRRGDRGQSDLRGSPGALQPHRKLYSSEHVLNVLSPVKEAKCGSRCVAQVYKVITCHKVISCSKTLSDHRD